MNLRDLKYLVAVAEEQHFGRAALRVNVSQPTLSMQLKKLEEELGVVCFERGKQFVRLTPQGAQMKAKAQAILQLESQMRELAKHSRDPLAGELQLGAFPTLAPYFLPALMPLLRQALPMLSVKLVEAKTADLLEKLDEGVIDCALIAAPVEHGNIATLHLFDEPFYLAVGQTHPLAHKKAITLADIEPYPLMLLDEGHCLREQALAVCHRMGGHESSSYRATSLEMLRGMVASGREITLMPQRAMRSDDGILYVPFDKPPMRSILLCYRHTSPRSALMLRLAEIFRKN